MTVFQDLILYHFKIAYISRKRLTKKEKHLLETCVEKTVPCLFPNQFLHKLLYFSCFLSGFSNRAIETSIIIANYSDCLIKKLKQPGLKGFIRFIKETMSSLWLEHGMVIKQLNRKFQLRLA